MMRAGGSLAALTFVLWGLWLIAAGGSLVAFIMATSSAVQRPRVLARYPVGWVTWILLTPFMAALVAALALLTDGVSQLYRDDVLWAMVPGSALILCVVVGVWCTRARKGRMTAWPWLPAAAGFGVPVLTIVLMVWADGFHWGFTVAALGLSMVCGANGLLAMWLSEHRRLNPPADPLVPGAPMPTDHGSDFRHAVPPPPPAAPNAPSPPSV